MKLKFTIIVFLLTKICFTNGQSVKSIFGPDTTRWNIYECSPDAGGTIQYFSYNDTIIDSITYQILYRKNINNLSGYRYTYICGFIKEDTIEGKYWFLKNNNEKLDEYLFMDLSLKQEDTFGIVINFNFMIIDSVKIDTTYYENNRKIIELSKFHYDCSNELKIKFIEGVGPSNGFYMGEDNEWPYKYSLLCKYDNEQLVYSTISNRQENCILDPGANISKNKFETSITVYPVPSKSLINIDIKNFNSYNYQYFIYNLLGELINSGIIKASRTAIVIDKIGIYSLVIFNKNNIVTKRIIINGT